MGFRNKTVYYCDRCLKDLGSDDDFAEPPNVRIHIDVDHGNGRVEHTWEEMCEDCNRKMFKFAEDQLGKAKTDRIQNVNARRT